MQTRALGLGLFTTVILACASTPPAQAEEQESQRVTQAGVVRLTGDIELTHSVRLPLRSYNSLKRQVKNTQMLLRRLGVHGQTNIYRHAKAAYDDEARSIRVTALMLAGMKNAGAIWWTPVSNPEQQEVLDLSDRKLTLLSIIKQDGAATQLVTTSLRFPEGTKRVRWNAKRGRIECELPPIASDPQGDVRLVSDVEVRPEIMGCFYKLYGLPQFERLWVARATFRNGGNATARDFRVRYRIVNYADWSPWQRTPRLQPGQTAVEAYYPIFDHKVRELTAETPSVLEVEWSYTGSDGQRAQGSDTHRITLLGMNQAVFSSLPESEVVLWDELFDNVPLLAGTFISHTDPVIQQFAGMVAAGSRGAAAGVDDESALRFVRALYALMVHNRIAYQWPPGLFKRGLRQHVKYGRDVLRNRAGTCIDLSILFASTCEAGGLAAYLVVVPGHAFPAVRLPSGKLLPIESTGISIRKEGGAHSFEQALSDGDAILRKSMEAGTYLLCDIQALRRSGVPPPELPTLPPGTLASWGITALSSPPGTAPPTTTPPGSSAVYTAKDGLARLTLPAHWVVENQPGKLEMQGRDFASYALLNWWPRKAASLAAFVKTLKESSRRDANAGFTFTKERAGEISGLPCHVMGATRDFGGKPHRVLFILLQTKHADVLFLIMAAKEAFQSHEEELAGIVDSLQIDTTVQPNASLSAPEEFFGKRAAPPPTTAARTHKDPKGRFHIAIPAGWEFLRVGDVGVRIQAPDQGAVATLQITPRKHADAAAYAAAVGKALTSQADALGRKTELRKPSGGTLLGSKTPFSAITAIHRYPKRVGREEWICVVAGKLQYSLALSAPADAWERHKPNLVAIFRGFRIPGAKPTPPKQPAVAALPLVDLRDAAGLYELAVPKGWKVTKAPGRLSVASSDGNALVDLTWMRREGREHATFVTRAKTHIASSFTKWKVEKTTVGTLKGFPVERLVGAAELTGTQAFAEVYLLSTPSMHWMLIMAGPPERRRSLAPAYTAIAKRWTLRDPEALPELALREVTTANHPYTVKAPSNWRVEPDGMDLVAQAPEGDAFIACRVSEAKGLTIDALGAAVLARMKARASAFRVVKQEVREVAGSQLLHALIEDTRGGIPWVRELRVRLAGDQALLFVQSIRADTAFKWAAHLGRVAQTWKPR